MENKNNMDFNPKEIIRKLSAKENIDEKDAYDFILSVRGDKVSDVQMGAFSVSLFMKGPTAEEIAGIVKAMRKCCDYMHPNTEGILTDCCGTGGGKTTFNISTCSAIVAAAVGIPMAKHGSRSISALSGSADAFEKLGVNINLTPKQAERLIEETNISFLYAPLFHPVMGKIFDPESQLGIKTVFYTIIGPLINPANAKAHVLGVYKASAVNLVSDVVLKLPYEHVLVVYGMDGFDEISITGKTKVAEIKEGNRKFYEIAPEDFGLARASLKEIEGGTPEYNAEVIRSILSGREKGAKRDVVLLNAGAVIYVGGKAKTISEGINMARAVIESSAAAKKLEELVTVSNALKEGGKL